MWTRPTRTATTATADTDRCCCATVGAGRDAREPTQSPMMSPCPPVLCWHRRPLHFANCRHQRRSADDDGSSWRMRRPAHRSVGCRGWSDGSRATPWTLTPAQMPPHGGASLATWTCVAAAGVCTIAPRWQSLVATAIVDAAAVDAGRCRHGRTTDRPATADCAPMCRRWRSRAVHVRRTHGSRRLGCADRRRTSRPRRRQRLTFAACHERTSHSMCRTDHRWWQQRRRTDDSQTLALALGPWTSD